MQRNALAFNRVIAWEKIRSEGIIRTLRRDSLRLHLSVSAAEFLQNDAEKPCEAIIMRNCVSVHFALHLILSIFLRIQNLRSAPLIARKRKKIRSLWARYRVNHSISGACGR